MNRCIPFNIVHNGVTYKGSACGAVPRDYSIYTFAFDTGLLLTVEAIPTRHGVEWHCWAHTGYETLVQAIGREIVKAWGIEAYRSDRAMLAVLN